MQNLLRMLTLATAAWLGLAAQAQVVRCTDTRTGATTYTDGGCARGTTAVEVEARKTPEEIEQERAQATQALGQKQQRLQAEAAAARLDAQREAQQRQRDQATRAPARDYARSPECARSRRNLDVIASSASGAPFGQDARLQVAQRQMELDCLGPEGYAELARNQPQAPPVVVYPPPLRPGVRPPPPQPPPQFTHCNVFRCYDRQGRSYPRP